MTETLFPTDEEVEGLLVGPESVAWRFGSDPRLYLAALYALLLQVAHPVVGAGVRDYSDFDKRPWDRLFGTVDYLDVLIYGGAEATAMGRRLRAMHKGFQGVREDGRKYSALEPDAYAWVHATLIEAYVAGHAQFARPMRPDQIERFYREYRGLGRFVGVRERDLPPDWAGFREYVDGVVADELQHTETVDRVLRALHKAKPPSLPIPGLVWRAIRMPMGRALWLGGVGLTSPLLRERLGIPWTRLEEAEFRALGAATRALTPLMPKRLLIMGPGQLRLRRRAIARGPLGPGREPSASDVAAAA